MSRVLESSDSSSEGGAPPTSTTQQQTPSAPVTSTPAVKSESNVKIQNQKN